MFGRRNAKKQKYFPLQTQIKKKNQLFQCEKEKVSGAVKNIKKKEKNGTCTVCFAVDADFMCVGHNISP